jgi:predicted Zn-ribbon and HTH transcriptional regulator
MPSGGSENMVKKLTSQDAQERQIPHKRDTKESNKIYLNLSKISKLAKRADSLLSLNFEEGRTYRFTMFNLKKDVRIKLIRTDWILLSKRQNKHITKKVKV